MCGGGMEGSDGPGFSGLNAGLRPELLFHPGRIREEHLSGASEKVCDGLQFALAVV